MDSRGEEVASSVDTCDDSRHLAVQSHVVFEYRGEIVGDETDISSSSLVVYSLDTCELLERLSEDSKECSPEVLGRTAGRQLLESEIADRLGVKFDYTSPGAENLCVGHWSVLQSSENGNSFGMSTFGSQPSR
jgi:hypothetical protein